MRRFLKQIGAHFVAEVPPDIHACEMCALAPTCTTSFAETCTLRLEAAVAERRWRDGGRPEEFELIDDEECPESEVRPTYPPRAPDKERCA